MHPAVLVGALVGVGAGAAALVKKVVGGRGPETVSRLSGHQLVSGPYALWGHHLVGHGHHGGHGGGGFRGFGGYSDPYAWAPLAPACPPGYMLDAFGRCVPAVPAQVSGPSGAHASVGQSSAAYCYGRRVR
jgi:hypothetical protein